MPVRTNGDMIFNRTVTFNPQIAAAGHPPFSLRAA